MSSIDAAEVKSQKTPDAADHSYSSFLAYLHGANPQSQLIRQEEVIKAEAILSSGTLDFGSIDQLYGSALNALGKSEERSEDKREDKSEKKSSGLPSASGDVAGAGGALGDTQNPIWKALREKSEARPPVASSNEISAANINPSGVDQSSVGDCFFDSALASMANSSKGREALQNMIKTNSDGSYTVTFPGDQSSPVTVTAKDLSNNQANGQVSDSAQWARVVETAFLKYDHAEQYGSGLNGSFSEQEGISGFANVATTDKALQLLTGQSVSTDALCFTTGDGREITLGSTSQANVARNIQSALNSGEPITASASSAGFMTHLGENSSGPMEGDHVYSVLSYDAKTGDVVVRNPWGQNDGTGVAKVGSTTDGITNLGGGKLQMSLNTFTQRFTSLNFAGQNDYLNDTENVWHDVTTDFGGLGHTGSDLFHGRFGSLPGDLIANVDNNLRTDSDFIYAATDSTERTVKSGLAHGFDYASYTVHGAILGLQDLGHDLDPLNW